MSLLVLILIPEYPRVNYPWSLEYPFQAVPFLIAATTPQTSTPSTTNVPHMYTLN